jgi:hypothetical protein
MLLLIVLFILLNYNLVPYFTKLLYNLLIVGVVFELTNQLNYVEAIFISSDFKFELNNKLD